MTEAHLDYESPYKSGGYSSSKEQRMNDLYYSESGKKHGFMDSGSKYDALKSSEREISGHLDKATHYQDRRLNDEMDANKFYKRELENIRSELNKKRNKVQSNHFSNDEDYLLQSTKDRIKNLQYLREKELSERFESPKPDNAAFSSAEKSNQKYKLHEEDWQNRTDEKWKASHLTESVGTNKTYDLSQSLRGSSNEYREKVTGGLKSLEEKMNLMERELDEHLSHRNKEYFTNKELVKQRQRQREQELRNRELENTDEDDDEEEARMESMQKKELRSENKASAEQFKSVFDKREERLEHDQQEIERETARKVEEQEEEEEGRIQEENSSDVEDEQVDVENKRAFEQELEFLKEENQRIKNELLTIKDNYETQKRHGEVKLHAADILAQENSKLSAKTAAALKTSTRVIREPAKLKSNKTFAESKETESINNTIKRAKKEVQTKLAENKLQREKSLNKKKNATLEKSQKKPEFLGIRNELYKKYYGYPVHLKEASYFLSKGIPTTYMSDSRPEVAHSDAATSLPKRGG